MAVLKANSLIRDGGGEIVRLPRGMSRDALEALADEYGDRTQRILDNEALWVDQLEDEPARHNLLGDARDSVVQPKGTAAKRRSHKARNVEDVVTEAKPRRGHKPAEAADTPEE